MNMAKSHEAQRYLHKLRCCLRCPRAARKRFLGEVEAVMMDYLEENPDADYAALCAHLGTPWELAFTVYEIVPPKELKSYRRKRIALLVLLILLVMVVFGVVIWKVTVDHTYRRQVEVETTVTIIEKGLIEE